VAAAVGVGAISGVLIGEGVYGLAYISDTTYTPYWWVELAAGVALLALGGVSRLPQIPAATSAGVCAATAVAFVAVYSLDLIGVLP
jgi:hypothetical protein